MNHRPVVFLRQVRKAGLVPLGHAEHNGRVAGGVQSLPNAHVRVRSRARLQGRTGTQGRTVKDHRCHIFWNPIRARRLRPVTGFFPGISIFLVILGGTWALAPGKGGNLAFSARKRGRQSGARQAGKRAEHGFPIHGELAFLAD